MVVSVDIILFTMFVLSCVIKGALFEVIFWGTFIALVFRNLEKILHKWRQYAVFLFIIFCYFVLMLIQIQHSNFDMGWRIVGITKCLCGISMCILISDRLCPYNIYIILLRFLLVFNFYVIFNIKLGGFILENSIFELPGENSCICLNLLMWPHFFGVHIKENKIEGFLYMFSQVLLFFLTEGASYKIGFVIIGGYVLLKQLKLKRKFSRISEAILFNMFIIIVEVLLYGLVFCKAIRMFYFCFLEKLDISRVEILTYGIQRRLELQTFENIFGSGEILYAVAYGRMIQAHNFIIETLTVYGVIGVIVLSIETMAFVKYVYSLKKKNCYWREVVVSIILGYMTFMVHPFYTTSFLIKIYLILLNFNTCYYGVTRQNVKKNT